MDKLQFPISGGYHFSPEDIEFEQEAYRGVIHALIAPIAQKTGGYLILSGVNVSSPANGIGHYISEGYVVLDYEIRYFPGATISNFGFSSILADDSDDPLGGKLLANGQQYNGLKRRRAKLVQGFTGMSIVDSLRYDAIMRKLIEDAPAQEIFLLSFNGWNQPGRDALKAKIRGRIGCIFGNINIGILSEVDFIQISSLPPLYRPLNSQTHIVPISDGVALLELRSTGEIMAKAINTVNIQSALVLHVPEIKYELA